ncbi:MAG: hypothetical protein NT062_34290 [Proteobacteria bacterium]|nr:hypothetical protein [Pseudomonadota bacterium]
MRCLAVALLVLIGCAHGPKVNEVVFKVGRKVTTRALVTSATFCPGCGENAPVTITFGTPPHVSVVIPLCYAHAHSKIGDHDKLSIELALGHVAATEGQIDIADCTSKHLVASVWAVFPDGSRLDANIDSELVDPGH